MKYLVPLIQQWTEVISFMKLANGRSINEAEYCPTLYKKVTKLTGVGEISVDIHGIGQKITKMLPYVSVLEKETGKIRSFINIL